MHMESFLYHPLLFPNFEFRLVNRVIFFGRFFSSPSFFLSLEILLLKQYPKNNLLHKINDIFQNKNTTHFALVSMCCFFFSVELTKLMKPAAAAAAAASIFHFKFVDKKKFLLIICTEHSIFVYDEPLNKIRVR